MKYKISNVSKIISIELWKKSIISIIWLRPPFQLQNIYITLTFKIVNWLIIHDYHLEYIQFMTLMYKNSNDYDTIKYPSKISIKVIEKIFEQKFYYTSFQNSMILYNS